MRVEYAPRARADLIEIADYSRAQFGGAVASALETYIRATVARIAAMPESGESVPERSEIRVVSLPFPHLLYSFRGFRYRDDFAHSPHIAPAMEQRVN
jgi:plasmid stabilization system protein ParE